MPGSQHPSSQNPARRAVKGKRPLGGVAADLHPGEARAFRQAAELVRVAEAKGRMLGHVRRGRRRDLGGGFAEQGLQPVPRRIAPPREGQPPGEGWYGRPSLSLLSAAYCGCRRGSSFGLT